MAQQKIAYDLTGERVAEVYGGLLHTAKNLEANLSVQQVYDGLGTPTALSVGGQGAGANVEGKLNVIGDSKTTGNSEIVGNLTINGNLAVSGTSINFSNNTNFNDLILNSKDSEVTARSRRTLEVGKLRVREVLAGSNYEITFGNPTNTADPDVFKILIDGTNNNFYIINNSTQTNLLSSPLWIDKTTSDVVVRRLKVAEQTNVFPIGMISIFRSSKIPNGWLQCNGQDVLKTSYTQLCAVLGDNYNGTNPINSNYFRVPNISAVNTYAAGFQPTVPDLVYCIRALEY